MSTIKFYDRLKTLKILTIKEATLLHETCVHYYIGRELERDTGGNDKTEGFSHSVHGLCPLQFDLPLGRREHSLKSMLAFMIMKVTSRSGHIHRILVKHAWQTTWENLVNSWSAQVRAIVQVTALGESPILGRAAVNGMSETFGSFACNRGL